MLEVKEIRCTADRQRAMDVRRRVFVEEQRVPLDLEIDEHEDESRHFLALDDGSAVGTGRVRRTREGDKIERVAVIFSHRGRGVGTKIVETILSALERPAPGEHHPIYVYAQVSATGFWEGLGFIGEGALFDEAGILHRKMRLETGRRPLFSGDSSAQDGFDGV